ncbi:hypothetical protein [Dokdonia sp.]|uniref:hypothetical protein n=1 Tax=Dokdonia sp. TaxID=2024995 RepID=UPI003266C969
MEISTLNTATLLQKDKKLEKKVNAFRGLLKELRERELPESVIISINDHIKEVNALTSSKKAFSKKITKKKSCIINLLHKELKLVPKNYYRNLWMVLGMSAFGLPLGVVFGTIIDNMGLLGLGMPIGMGIGIALGTMMDQKAQKNNKQLDFAG